LNINLLHFTAGPYAVIMLWKKTPSKNSKANTSVFGWCSCFYR